MGKRRALAGAGIDHARRANQAPGKRNAIWTFETEHTLNKALFIIPFALGSLASSAQAQTMPRYNVDNYCQQVAEVSGGSAMIFNGCMEMEQEAYNGLRSAWAQLPGKSRNYCDEVARVSGGSYSILQGCMEMETDAAQTPRTFNY